MLRAIRRLKAYLSNLQLNDISSRLKLYKKIAFQCKKKKRFVRCVAFLIDCL